MTKSGNSVEMPNGWEAWFWANPSCGWSFEMRHKSGDQVGGNQRSEEMARKVAGIIADTTHVEPPKPADPAWMVEVAREGCATAVEGWTQEVAVKYREGAFDEYPFVRASITTLRLALERGHVVEIGPIREMLLAGQGDDDGSQILPDLHDGMTLHAMVAACVHLLERRRDALDGYANSGSERRPVPSDEELLKAAREDAAQYDESMGDHDGAAITRAGGRDKGRSVPTALQARRNMLREVGEPAKMARKATLNAVRPNGDIATFYTAGEPGRVDLEAALKRAWEAGAYSMADAVSRVYREDNGPSAEWLADRKRIGVASILSALPAKE